MAEQNETSNNQIPEANTAPQDTPQTPLQPASSPVTQQPAPSVQTPAQTQAVPPVQAPAPTQPAQAPAQTQAAPPAPAQATQSYPAPGQTQVNTPNSAPAAYNYQQAPHPGNQPTQAGFQAPQGHPINTSQQAYYYSPQSQQAQPQANIPPYQQKQQASPYGVNQGQSGYQYSYPQSPYANQQTYQDPVKKTKIWPWVLAICLVVGILGIGGCVSLAVYLSAQPSYSSQGIYQDFKDEYKDYSDDYSDDYYDDWYDYYNDNNEDFDKKYDEFNDDSKNNSSNILSLDEIKSLGAGFDSKIVDGVCSTGMYEAGKDIDAGLYYLEGSQKNEGRFVVFEQSPSEKGYRLTQAVGYYGNYFVDLAEGDIIIFAAPDDAHMYSAEKASIETGKTINSGCYRVGKDIPAGKYQVSYQQNEADSSKDSQGAGVYVMKDLEWNSGSIVESYGLMPGSRHTITVTDGQYVELYHGTMTSTAS